MLLYGIGITLLFICALRYFGMARKKENPNEKLINRAFGLFLIGFTIQSSLLVLYFLSLEGYPVDHSFRGNLELENISLLSEWLYRGSWITWHTSGAIFIHAVEKIQDKKIPVGPIIGIIGIFFAIFLPTFEMFLIIGSIPFLFMALYELHVLFTLMKWAKKELKAATSFVFLGTILISNPLMFTIPNTMMAGAMPSIVLPLSLITGAILNLAPTIVNPKFFLRSTSYWYAFLAGVIGYFMFMLVFEIISSPEYAINTFILLIYISVECAFFLKSVLKEEGASTKKSVDVTGIFTRPETITEEEVSISKEKKVCLVCKGKLGGFNKYIFMCPDCNAFYCEKCSKALSNLENTCWACYAPINPSKPSKPLEQEEKEEVVVEEGVPKKGGGDAK